MENHEAIWKHELDFGSDMETSLSLLFVGWWGEGGINGAYKSKASIIKFQFQFGKIFLGMDCFCRETLKMHNI